MSAKLFNCTPAQLPADLKANLVTMLQCGVNALEGYIRPGCVHLARRPPCAVFCRVEGPRRPSVYAAAFVLGAACRASAGRARLCVSACREGEQQSRR